MSITCYGTNPWLYNGVTPIDFEWRQKTTCPLIPFNYPEVYPVNATIGDRLEYYTDSLFSRDDRLRLITSGMPTIPFSVDVDKLTDDEFANTCLTVAQCRYPPMIELLRKVSDGQPVTPSLLKGCINQPTGSMKPPKDLPPVVTLSVRCPDMIVKTVKYYPRGSTATNATIAKIQFGLSYYTYVDLTCSSGKGYTRRDGFFGRLNGNFKEIVLRPSVNAIHLPLRQDKGYSGTHTVKFEGGPFWLYFTQSYQFATVSNNLKTAGAIYAGLQWSMLQLPVGAKAVSLAYFVAAQTLKGDPDWVGLENYLGTLYTKIKPGLDYLSTKINGKYRYLSIPVGCTPPVNTVSGAPELDCGQTTCLGWDDRKCDPFWDIVNEARSLVINDEIQTMPQCVDCPGLMGVLRAPLSPSNTWQNVLPLTPQCLPFQTSDGRMISTPEELFNVKKVTKAPNGYLTVVPNTNPTRAPVYTNDQWKVIPSLLFIYILEMIFL